LNTWSLTWSGSEGGIEGVTGKSDSVVLAGAFEVGEGEEDDDVAEVWKVVGVEEGLGESAGPVICAKDEAGRTMERKRSVDENGSDCGIENVGRWEDGEVQDARKYSLLEEESVITISWQLLITAHVVTREDSRQWGY